jgi:hypothetical protein
VAEEKSNIPYGDKLAELPSSIPHVAELLIRAHNNRTKSLNLRAHGIRLSGLDEWIGYLKELEAGFDEPHLKSIKFLVIRIRSNYEVALEATLAGIPSAVFDSMRDAMEVDLLLQDFAADKDRIDLWLVADNKMLMNEFAPKHLRRRKAKRLGLVSVRDLADTRDYGAHSHALHVQPGVHAYERRGLVELGHPVLDDFCYWEMLGHALSLCETIEALLKSLAPHLSIASNLDARLPKLHKAHVSVLEWNEIMRALATAVEESGDSEAGTKGDDSTTD